MRKYPVVGDQSNLMFGIAPSHLTPWRGDLGQDDDSSDDSSDSADSAPAPAPVDSSASDAASAATEDASDATDEASTQMTPAGHQLAQNIVNDPSGYTPAQVAQAQQALSMPVGPQTADDPAVALLAQQSQDASDDETAANAIAADDAPSSSSGSGFSVSNLLSDAASIYKTTASLVKGKSAAPAAAGTPAASSSGLSSTLSSVGSALSSALSEVTSSPTNMALAGGAVVALYLVLRKKK